MTAHRRALDLAAASLDWDLTGPERDEMDAHLATCTSCQHADAIQRGQVAALRRLTYAATPATVRRVVLAAAAGDLRRRTHPMWTLLAAATLIALAVLGGAVGAFLFDRERDAIVIDFSAVPSPRPSAVDDASPAPIPPPMSVAQREALQWTALPEAAEVFRDATIGSVVQGPTGFVALGQSRSTLTSLVWVSLDGVSWESVPQPSDVFGGGVPTHVVAGGPGYVAVGWDISVEHGTRRTAWTSPDGRRWQPSPDPTGQFGTVDILGMAGGGGIVAVLASETEGSVPVMLLSSDGLAWERSAAPALGVTGVARSTTGLVAFGFRDGRAEAWFSADGRSWAKAPVESAIDGDAVTQGPLERVVSSGSRLLAQGRGPSGTRYLWASIDGRRWTALPEGANPGGSAVVAGGNGAFLAYLVPTAPDAPLVAWTSLDGETWIVLANSPSGFSAGAASPAVNVNHVVQTEGGWVLSGYETTEGAVVAWAIR